MTQPAFTPQVEIVKVDDLAPYEQNPRIIPDTAVAAVADSIREFGFLQPIVIDDDGSIAAGHTRLQAAKRLGLLEVPIIRAVHLTPDQIRAYRLSDNRTGEYSGWHMDMLAREVVLLEDAPLPGFQDDELAVLRNFAQHLDVPPPLPFPTEPTPEVDVDAPVEPVREPVSKRGDVWQLGRHRLMCGDSSNADDVAQLLDGATPRLMVADPPYGVDHDPDWRNHATHLYGEQRTGLVSNDDKVDWGGALTAYQPAVAYVWAPSLYSAEFVQIIRAAKYDIRAQLIWRKQKAAFSRGHYHWAHEPCWYAVRHGHQAGWIGDRKQTTIWDIANLNPMGGSRNVADAKTEHTTQKPVECMERPIRNHEGDVYDPFVGSGTTIIAAERQNRTCYAMEIDPSYVDAAVRRWEAYTKQRAEHIPSASE